MAARSAAGTLPVTSALDSCTERLLWVLCTGLMDQIGLYLTELACTCTSMSTYLKGCLKNP